MKSAVTGFCDKLTFPSLSICVKTVLKKTMDDLDFIFPGINMGESKRIVENQNLKRKFKIVEL